MNFSQENEQSESNFTSKQLRTGKALYKVVAVNPNKEKLKELGQYVPADEPVYIGKREIDGKEYPLANITVYLQDPNDFNIIDKVTYSVVDNVQTSATGKVAAINKYGSDAWIDPTALDSGNLPENMNWYLSDGVKRAKRGEKELVRFIRALRNFKHVTSKSTQEEKDGNISVFGEDDLQKLFRGDFSDITKVLMANPDSKVGMFLGIRNADNGKVYQDIYKEYPLRAYMVGNEGSNEYIAKEVREAQENGKYSNSYFDLSNLSLKAYDPNSVAKPDDMNGNLFSGKDESDDLPF